MTRTDWCIPIVGHVPDMFGGTARNLLQNHLSSLRTDMMAKHDPMGLVPISNGERNAETSSSTHLRVDDSIHEEGREVPFRYDERLSGAVLFGPFHLCQDSISKFDDSPRDASSFRIVVDRFEQSQHGQVVELISGWISFSHQRFQA